MIRRWLGVLLLGATAGGNAAAAQVARVSLEPIVTIGAEGSGTNLVRVILAARVRTGDIAVLTNSPPELLLFSSNGTLRKRPGRPGSGPGEFSLLWWAGRDGDSVLVYDFGLARATVFDIPRDTVWTLPFLPKGAPGRLVVGGKLDGGSWLALGMPRPYPDQHPDGPFRDTTTAYRWQPDSSATVLATFRNLALFAHNPKSDPGSTHFRFDPLLANAAILTHGGRVWIADPSTDSVVVLDSDGQGRSTFGVPLPSGEYNPAVVRHVRDNLLATARRSTDSALTTAAFDLSRRPPRGPRAARLLPGPAGQVWIEAFRVDPSAATEYVLVDARGRVQLRLTGPPAVRFHDIGPDYALGVHRNADDVETVVLFRVARVGDPPG